MDRTSPHTDANILNNGLEMWCSDESASSLIRVLRTKKISLEASL